MRRWAASEPRTPKSRARCHNRDRNGQLRRSEVCLTRMASEGRFGRGAADGPKTKDRQVRHLRGRGIGQFSLIEGRHILGVRLSWELGRTGGRKTASVDGYN